VNLQTHDKDLQNNVFTITKARIKLNATDVCFPL